MRKFLLIPSMVIVLTASLAFTSQASASTRVTVRASFAEPVVPAFESGDCPVLGNGFCGSGVVVPFGYATEMVDFFRRVRRGLRHPHDQPRSRIDPPRRDGH